MNSSIRISEEDDDEIYLGKDLVTKGRVVSRIGLVGHLLTRYPYNKRSFQRVMEALWKPNPSFLVKEIE